MTKKWGFKTPLGVVNLRMEYSIQNFRSCPSKKLLRS